MYSKSTLNVFHGESDVLFAIALSRCVVIGPCVANSLVLIVNVE